MKVIDLLNKISNGEEVPKKIRIEHWCYKFEWVEHKSNYYDKHEDIDLMSCLSCDKEELNYEVHEIEEENKIPEKLETFKDRNNEIFLDDLCYKYMPIHKDSLSFNEQVIVDKLNEVLDYLKNKGE